MIIVDDSPKSPRDLQLPSTEEAPPAYRPPPLASSQQQPFAGPVPSYGAAQINSQVAYYQHVNSPRPSSSRKRFCKAFFVAILIWFLLSTLVGSIIEVTSPGRHNSWRIQPGDYPIPGEISLEHCETATSLPPHLPSASGSWSYYVHKSFDLPITSETLFLLSKGALSSGSVEIATSTDVADTARVDIIVKYHRLDVLERAKLCSVKRAHGESGVGIFTPTRWWTSPSLSSQLSFEVKIMLPEPSKSSPLLIKKLETDVDNFAHLISDLSRVEFQQLSLKGSNKVIRGQSLYFHEGSLHTSNAPISLDLLKTGNASIKTSNGPIIGQYDVTGYAYLKTSNAPIRTTVSLGGTDSVSNSGFFMDTTNAKLDSDITLLSSSEGSFVVVPKTSNGALRVTIPSAPLDSSIMVEGKTSNGAIDVSVPSTFEGIFDLTTSSHETIKAEHLERKDPSGRGRKASFYQYWKSRTEVLGFKYWDKAHEERGAVVLKTSNGRVSLYL